MTGRRLAEMGEIMQIAFVPEDFDGAIQHWVAKGAGPFFVLRDNKAEYQTCYGVETYPILDIALGHWGDMQIEVIRQNNPEVKSVYSDWRKAGSEGVHHTCIIVDDIEEARAECARNGWPLVIEGEVMGTKWVYADTKGGPGTYLEIIQYADASRGLMDMIRDAARGWDGKDPVREIGI